VRYPVFSVPHIFIYYQYFSIIQVKANVKARDKASDGASDKARDEATT